MKYTQIHFKSDRIIIKYDHSETERYGLAITHKSIQGMNLQSVCSWINKVQEQIARHVYKKHDLILDNYIPSHFEKSKLSPEDYLERCKQEAKEYNEKESLRRKLIGDSDSMFTDLMLGIRST